jgi:hypothetical protein
MAENQSFALGWCLEPVQVSNTGGGKDNASSLDKREGFLLEKRRTGGWKEEGGGRLVFGAHYESCMPIRDLAPSIVVLMQIA